MPKPRNLKTVRNLDPVTAAEAGGGELTRAFDLYNVTVVLMEAGLDTDTGRWNFILHRKNVGSGSGINLAQNLKQRDIGQSVIWEGRLFIPAGWRLTFFCRGIVAAADPLTTRIIYED